MRSLGLALLVGACGPASEPREPLSRPRQLTFDGKRAGEAYFDARGERVVFQSEREADNPFYAIYAMDLRAGVTRRLSPCVGKTTCGWLHPDGARALFASTHEDPDARAD